MTLYEINQAILDCIDMETGEVLDIDLLENLQMEKSQKIENIACLIKNYQAMATALKAEKEALAEREKKTLAKVESLKNWLAAVLEGNKFSTAKCDVKFRKSVQVEVLNEYLIPAEFLVKTVTVNPDKVAIKEMLKHGQEVSGCRLIENQNISIK